MNFNIRTTEADIIPNYNVVSTQEILTIIKHDNENKLVKLHWGLVPFWAKDISIGSRMINARAETVAIKPSFRNAFNKRRCLIPADGFYGLKLAAKKQAAYLESQMGTISGTIADFEQKNRQKFQR